MSSTVTGLLRQGLRLAAQPVGPALSQRGLHVSSSHNKMFPVNSDGRISCTLIPGDGVGPELMDATQDVLNAIGVPIDFETFHLSEIQHGISANLEEVTKSIEKNGIALKGVIAVPDASFDGNLMNLNQTFRKSLDLYASVVKVRSLPGVKTRHPNIDMVIIREQVEGEYSALEHESVPGVVECLKVVTKQRSRRIAKFAFDYATRHQRERVTAVHKANIMKLGDGLFLRSCEEVAELYPNIKFEKMIVDNTTMQMVSKPQQFDVMVMPNLYGNIIDNLATGLVGGAGLVAGASYSADVAVFEPGARHTFDEGVGRNVANPTAMLLSAAKLLEHVGLDIHAKKIKLGVDKVLRAGKVRTRDLGGHASTREFARAVVDSI